MKLDYGKINNCFFLISLCITLLSSFLIASGYKDYFSSVFIAVYLVSIFICAVFFYRFNNGLIAILRGKFAKPSAKNKRFVDYDKPMISNAEKLKNTILYGEKSLLFYKLNTREVYQIIKLKDRFLIHRCFVTKGKVTGLITDFSSAESVGTSKSDTQIYFKNIQSVIYKISETNFYLPILSINVNKTHFRFIGIFEKIHIDDARLFFDDVCKVRVRNSAETAFRKKHEKDKSVFKYNILCLIACISSPNLISIHLINKSTDKFYRYLLSFYMFVSIAVLISAVLLSVLKSDKYSLGIFTNRTDKRKDTSGIFIITATSIFIVVTFQSVVNLTWYIILTAIVSAVFIFIYLNTAYYSDAKRKIDRAATILFIVVIFLITSSGIVSGVNFLVPVKESTQTCHIMETNDFSSRRSHIYYAKIRMDDKDINLRIHSDTYKSNKNFVKVQKTTGFLGVTYVTEVFD